MKLSILAAALGASLVAGALAASPARADDDSAAYRANVGLRIGLAPVLLIPDRGRPARRRSRARRPLRHPRRPGRSSRPADGSRATTTISHFIGIAMPTARVTFPIGPLAPFLVGGVGPGLVTNPSEGGVALLGGGGLMIHLGDVFAIGAEATYQTITARVPRAGGGAGDPSQLLSEHPWNVRRGAGVGPFRGASSSSDDGATILTVVPASQSAEPSPIRRYGPRRQPPPGIDCVYATDGTVTGTCAAKFGSGVVVALTATADSGSELINWVDTASGEDFDYEEAQGNFTVGESTSPTLSLNVDEGRELSVFAAFSAATH